jgi:hypothetical protein
MNTARACRFALLVAITANSLSAEVIRIHVIDGRNGKTITDEHLNLWINMRKGDSRVLVPGPDGIAELDLPAGSSIDVATNLYVDCRPYQKGVPSPMYSVDEIKRYGIATKNTCGKLGSEARQGELLFFVRPIHWWEAMRW